MSARLENLFASFYFFFMHDDRPRDRSSSRLITIACIDDCHLDPVDSARSTGVNKPEMHIYIGSAIYMYTYILVYSSNDGLTDELLINRLFVVHTIILYLFFLAFLAANGCEG